MSHLWKEKPDGDPEDLIAALKREIDWTLLESALTRSPEERLVRMEGRNRFYSEFRKATARAQAGRPTPLPSSGAG